MRDSCKLAKSKIEGGTMSLERSLESMSPSTSWTAMQEEIIGLRREYEWRTPSWVGLILVWTGAPETNHAG